MVCRPATQFCCGFSLDTGVKTILWFHFCQNFYQVFCAVSDVFLHMRAFSYTSNRTIEVAVFAFALAGMPFIGFGFWGVISKKEAPLRMYFLYLICSCVGDCIFVIYWFIFDGPCAHLAGLVSPDDIAFSCGFARFSDGIMVSLLFAIQFYMVHTVHSYCELVHDQEGACAFEQLTQSAHAKRQAYGIQVGGHHRHTIEDVSFEYGSMPLWGAQQEGLGGSRVLFPKVGGYHDLSYPPTYHPGEKV